MIGISRTFIKKNFQLQQISKLKITDTTSLTHSMQQSPSWDANWLTASQEIPRILRNPKVPRLQVPATCTYPEPDLSIPFPTIPLPEDPY